PRNSRHSWPPHKPAGGKKLNVAGPTHLRNVSADTDADRKEIENRLEKIWQNIPFPRAPIQSCVPAPNGERVGRRNAHKSRSRLALVRESTKISEFTRRT